MRHDHTNILTPHFHDNIMSRKEDKYVSLDNMTRMIHRMIYLREYEPKLTKINKSASRYIPHIAGWAEGT